MLSCKNLATLLDPPLIPLDRVFRKHSIERCYDTDSESLIGYSRSILPIVPFSAGKLGNCLACKKFADQISVSHNDQPITSRMDQSISKENEN